MYSFLAIFRTIHWWFFGLQHRYCNLFWCMVVYSMYSFRSWKKITERKGNPILKPYILYTTIHQLYTFFLQERNTKEQSDECFPLFCIPSYHIPQQNKNMLLHFNCSHPQELHGFPSRKKYEDGFFCLVFYPITLLNSYWHPKKIQINKEANI